MPLRTSHLSSPLLRCVAALSLASTVVLAGCLDARPASMPDERPASSENAGTIIARGKVELPGGPLPINAAVPGPLTSVEVCEGAQVSAGDVLAIIDSTVATLALKQAEWHVQRLTAVHEAATHALAESQRRARRFARAATEGAGDAQAADTAQALHRQREIEQTIAARDLDIARAERDIQRHRLAQHTLRAPQNGTIVRLDATVGRQAEPAGRPLMVMLPDLPIQIRAEVNESLASRVHAGMRAVVVAEGAPVHTGVDARVQHVGRMFAASRLDDDHPVRRNLRVIETLLTLDPKAHFRVGQNVSVTFYE